MATVSRRLGPSQSLRAHLAAERAALAGATWVRQLSVPLLFHTLKDLVQNVTYREEKAGSKLVRCRSLSCRLLLNPSYLSWDSGV